jgi:cell shape-determining protein MreC
MENKSINEHLKYVHQVRKAKTCMKVDEAIKCLIKARKSINFNSVAKVSGVSKATLYNNPEIRERINALRTQQKTVPSIKEMKKEKEEKSRIAIITSLKRKIRYLEEENEELKKQLKLHEYDEYKKC